MSIDDVDVLIEQNHNPPLLIEVASDEAILIELHDGLPGKVNPGSYIPPVSYSLTAFSSYNAAHSFPYYPAVRLFDVSGNLVDTDVIYTSTTNVHLVFAAPFTGTLILS